MEALGDDLKTLKDKLVSQNFTASTCYQIGIQMLTLLEALHSLDFVHNDLKLENIVIGRSDKTKLYLIDFGLSQTFFQDSEHTTKTYLRKFSGNFQFASLNSCRGFSKSRRDDVESLFYLLIYMLNASFLPWSDFENKCEQMYCSFKELLK